ncbi:MAG: hypothetical protein K2G67_01440 [Muribaculaceae bacterium]|nr:hypothetical protein [Muribaculaceae bacterium]
MEEGINMGRKCPWSKNYLKSLYQNLNSYCEKVTLQTFVSDGPKVASKMMVAYTMFKFPVVYLYIHYHYGTFEDLGMQGGEISSYMTYLPAVKHFTQGMRDGMLEENVFSLDKENALSSALIEICKEVIYIEENY